MDEELFKKGLEKRKATLGNEYVEKNLEKADDFTYIYIFFRSSSFDFNISSIIFI